MTGVCGTELSKVCVFVCVYHRLVSRLVSGTHAASARWEDPIYFGIVWLVWENLFLLVLWTLDV